MSKLRSINTAFWSDPFIEDLSVSEKLLYIYLITNEKTNMLGIYEVSIKKISFETGIDKGTVEKALKRFETLKKVRYLDNHIILVNFLKHQNFNTNMKKSAIDVYMNLPESIVNKELTLDKNNPLKAFETLSNHLGMVRKVEVELEGELESEYEKEAKEEIPVWLEFFNYAKEKCIELNYQIDESKLKAKYLAWKEAGWQTGKNKKIKNWKSTLLNTLVYLRKDENQKTESFTDFGNKLLEKYKA